ncbi:Hypothetical predicted protein, partial [Paramuricea clavata]
SLNLEPNYLVDKTFFHVGCGPCGMTNDAMVEVFAALSLFVGIQNLMTHLDTGLYFNVLEMVCAVGRYDKCLHYYTEEKVNDNSGNGV